MRPIAGWPQCGGSVFSTNRRLATLDSRPVAAHAPLSQDPKPRFGTETAPRVGANFLDIAQTAGGMGVLLGRCLSRLVRGRLDGQELWKNLHKMAVKSLPIVVVTALFTGAIMVIQAAVIVRRYNAEGLLGWGAWLRHAARDCAAPHRAHDQRSRRSEQYRGARDHGGHRAARRTSCSRDRPHLVSHFAALSRDHAHTVHDDALRGCPGTFRRGLYGAGAS